MAIANLHAALRLLTPCRGLQPEVVVAQALFEVLLGCALRQLEGTWWALSSRDLIGFRTGHSAKRCLAEA